MPYRAHHANRRPSTSRNNARRGAAALDYVLVLGVVLPLVAFIMGVAPRMIERVYEMVCLLISWPWM
jgi:hypothetical protein